MRHSGHEGEQTEKHRRRSTKVTSLPWICCSPYSLSCGGQVPDVGMRHYKDDRMQHRQCTQPALTGVTTVVAPRKCQHPLTECSLHPQRENQEKHKYPQRGKTTTWSTDEPVKPSLQLNTHLRQQTLSGRASSPSPPVLRCRGNGGSRESCQRVSTITLHCGLRSTFKRASTSTTSQPALMAWCRFAIRPRM